MSDIVISNVFQSVNHDKEKPILAMRAESKADVNKLAKYKLGDIITHCGVDYIASEIDKYQIIFVRID